MSDSQTIAGMRVLLLEDNFITALDLSEQLTARGAVVDGPHASIQEVRRACELSLPHIALLDVHVRDALSVPFASELVAAGVQVIFITGFGAIADLPSELANTPRLLKPVSLELLDEQLDLAALQVRAKQGADASG